MIPVAKCHVGDKRREGHGGNLLLQVVISIKAVWVPRGRENFRRQGGVAMRNRIERDHRYEIRKSWGFNGTPFNPM